MAVINHAKREINAKLVYYGPPGAGKASLFRYIHQRIKPSRCGPLKAMPAGGDSLLFFDYLPFETATLDGYSIRFHLYTLTGPVTHPGTWNMTLKGVDGVAMVAEAGQEQAEQTVQALRTLRGVMHQHGRDLARVPCVLISTKCDKPGQPAAGWGGDAPDGPAVCSSTASGEGVLQALAALSQEVLQRLREEHSQALATARECPAAPEELLASDDAVTDLPESSPQTVDASPSSGAVASLQVPLTLQIDGKPRSFTVHLSVRLEEVDGKLMATPLSEVRQA